MSRDRSTKLLDALERLLVLPLFGWMTFRLLRGYWVDGRAVSLLLVPNEALPALFLLMRREAVAIASRPADWLLALLGTVAPLLVFPTVGGPGLIPDGLGAALALMGLAIQVAAKCTLGRSYGLVAANRGLRRTGPYRVVRHPVYAGYLLSHVAFLLMNPSAWNLAMYGICEGLTVARIFAEERLLGGDPAYVAYRSDVRYRLIPGMF